MTTTDQQSSPKQEQELATTDVTEVAPGVLRTQLPIDVPGLGHVNCYLLEDERGVAVIDPGLPGPESWSHLVDRLERAGFAVADVHTAVVTHSHADHYGGAIRLQAEAGTTVVSHESFRTFVDLDDVSDSEDSSDLAVTSPDEWVDAIESFLTRPTPWGGERPVPNQDFFDRLRKSGTNDVPFAQNLRPTRRLVDGQSIRLAGRDWLAMHTPGHTHDHLCLFDPEHGVVFTGDHVLPSITPHISGLASDADPLAMFVTSLQRMIDMPDVSIALPAHGHPFADLGGRAEHIIQHHDGRLDVIRDATTELPSGTVSDFMKVLFRPRSWGGMAESETYAHLEHLRERGELSRTDSGGVARYSAK